MPSQVDVVVIGVSTGGPDALTTVILAPLPADLPVPVVIVQHMPPMFTGLFAQRLDAEERPVGTRGPPRGPTPPPAPS